MNRKSVGDAGLVGIPEIAFFVDLSLSLWVTCCTLRKGSSPSRRAIAPATWGQAIDVPLIDRVPTSDEGQAEKIELPGAHMSMQVPKLLNPDLLSARSVEPTVMALGAKAGLNLHASLLLLPAATTTATPPVIAASTACAIA